jgi:hypothetical protein
MRIKDLTQELEETKEHESFKKEHEDTFFAAAFLILDLENETEQIQLDYFLPKDNKIAAFSHPFATPKIHDNIISVSKQGATEPAKPTPMQPQTLEIKTDIDDLESSCNKIIKENNSALKPTKIIAILKDDIWNLTCMDNALGIIRIKINAISGEPADFNKGSLMDFMGMKKK